MIKLRIPLELASRNKFVGKHWNILYKEKKKWQESIAYSFMIAKANGHVHALDCPPCAHKRRLSVCSYRKRVIDPDNLDLKALIDALKRERLIVDDSAKWMEIGGIQQISIGKKGIPWTVVELENLP